MSNKKIDKSQIAFHPNPVVDNLNVNIRSSDELTLNFYIINGRTLMTRKIKDETSIYLSNYDYWIAICGN